LEEDALDKLLSRHGVYKRLKKKKPFILRSVTLIFESFRVYHGTTVTNIEILQKLVWDILRVDPVIYSFLVENADRFDLKDESENYGGPVSKRLAQKALLFAKEEGLLE
jgi:hypothetical protein